MGSLEYDETSSSPQASGGGRRVDPAATALPPCMYIYIAPHVANRGATESMRDATVGSGAGTGRR